MVGERPKARLLVMSSTTGSTYLFNLLYLG